MEHGVYIHGAHGKMGRALAAVAAKEGISLTTSLEEAGVAIDFSSPEALSALLDQCCRLHKPIVIGTTGHTDRNEEAIRMCSEEIPIFFSPNFSLGLAVCIEAARAMAAYLSHKSHVEIVETHHVHKKDQPSGSAIALGHAAGAQKIHSIRGGNLVGDHTVYFILEEERIELTHRVQSREAFARGALSAAEFVRCQPPKLYTMQDLLCVL